MSPKPTKVLHGQETVAFLDAGYAGLDKRPEIIDAQAVGKISSNIKWNVARWRITITKMAAGTMKTFTKNAQYGLPEGEIFSVFSTAHPI